MSGVFRGECLPAFGAGGGHTRWVERGWGANSSEDARHCSVLYICKYFVQEIFRFLSCAVPEVCKFAKLISAAVYRGGEGPVASPIPFLLHFRFVKGMMNIVGAWPVYSPPPNAHPLIPLPTFQRDISGWGIF
jgi:hypothetical protein